MFKRYVYPALFAALLVHGCGDSGDTPPAQEEDEKVKAPETDAPTVTDGSDAVESAEPEVADPRVTTVVYRGSGTAERSPEFAEVTFSFVVDCRTSANDVREAIGAISAPVWQEIVKAVPEVEGDGDFTETRARFAGEIGNINESAGARFKVSPPTIDSDTGLVVPGTVKRVRVCGGEEVEAEADVGTVFSGTQTFGLRTADLDFLEALVSKVNEDPRRGDQDPDAVNFGAGTIAYKITRATREEMLLAVQDQARKRATGSGSLLDLDREQLSFESARFLSRAPTFASPFRAQVGSPVKRGQAPKVSLELPLTYAFYAQADDVIAGGAEPGSGAVSQYPVTGVAVRDADYAETSIVVSTDCHKTPDAAAAAVAAAAEPVVAEVRDFHGDLGVSETDTFMNKEAGAPSPSHPYVQAEWNTDGPPPFKPTAFLNTCTNEIVPAPESGFIGDLPPVWSVEKVLVVKSSRFDDILGLVEGLQAEHNQAQADNDAVFVDVADANGAVTVASQQELERAARADATSQILDPAGQVAADARAFALLEIYFRGIAEGGRSIKVLSAFDTASSPESSLGGAGDDLAVEVIEKPNSERPSHVLTRHYDFTYEVKSQNYAAVLTAPDADPS